MPPCPTLRFEGLSVNEFAGLTFAPPRRPGPFTATGAEALERVSFERSTVRGAALAQSGIVAGAYRIHSDQIR